MDELKEFKDKLIELFRDELGASDENCKKIDECKTLLDIVSFFEDSDDLRDLFDLEEIKDLKSEIENLEEQVEDLEKDVSTLEHSVLELEGQLETEVFKAYTYWDEEKYELFLKYHEKFTPTEFEELLTRN